jgi:hypothetical protein
MLEQMLLLDLEHAVAPLLGVHSKGDALVEGVELDDAGAQRELRAVGSSPTVLGSPRRFREARPLITQPVPPLVSVGVRDLQVEQQRAAGIEAVVKAPERLDVLLPRAPEPECTAHEDRPVAPGRIELVHRRDEQPGREPLAARLLAAERDHVRRQVTAADVETRPQAGQEQPSRAARHVERGLAVAFHPAEEVRDLMGPEVVVELRPPLRDQPVVPGVRGGSLPAVHSSVEGYAVPPTSPILRR